MLELGSVAITEHREIVGIPAVAVMEVAGMAVVKRLYAIRSK
jgi:hypothetical protein